MTEIIWQPEILENDILKILPLFESDFDSLFEVASDPLIWEQHPASDRYKKEVFQLYFDGAISGKTAFKIIDRSTNKIIGSTRYYDYMPQNSSIAIGYTFLARQYWGGRYNKSSKKLIIDYAFQFVDKIYFHIGATNVRSQLATTRNGAIKIREFDSEQNGIKTASFEYQIEKKNWK
jgi:RimJ/RimL family protein N-acetyltransferase